jgi:repressor LexA
MKVSIAPSAPKALRRIPRSILQFIYDHTQEHGCPPNLVELRRGTKIPSTSTVHYHLKRLMEHGYLVQKPTIHDALILCEISYQVIERRPDFHLVTTLSSLLRENQRLLEQCEQLLQAVQTSLPPQQVVS